MLPSAIRDRLLVDEAQLGQRLNQDLRAGTVPTSGCTWRC